MEMVWAAALVIIIAVTLELLSGGGKEPVRSRKTEDEIIKNVAVSPIFETACSRIQEVAEGRKIVKIVMEQYGFNVTVENYDRDDFVPFVTYTYKKSLQFEDERLSFENMGFALVNNPREYVTVIKALAGRLGGEYEVHIMENEWGSYIKLAKQV